MKKLQSMDDVIQALGTYGVVDPGVNYETVEEIVDALVELGKTDKVFALYAGHFGLKDRLSKQFLKSAPSDSGKAEFESELGLVLEQAGRIVPLAGQGLSEDGVGFGEPIPVSKVFCCDVNGIVSEVKRGGLYEFGSEDSQ